MSAFQSFRSWAANSTIAHVGFAFLVMGGWAVFANRAHTVPEMLLAGVVQGTVSALLTLGLKKFLEWIAAKLSGVAALVVPPLITAASILAILFAAHTLAGTPEIAATIAFPFSVSTLYAIVYNWGLWRRGA
jgi:mannose/fructose/N-acetylgalactosamine-specific phosphotransferase system component IIC